MNQDIETIYRVHLPEEGVFLEVGDYAEAPEVLEVRSVRGIDKEWFGEVALTLQPNFAIQLGNALVSAGYNKLAQLKAGNY